ncbi:M23 family metallopeptidase [Risungbinella massiliensis]|uniref:M23 family metallopeptidase n=1 Tax=Risungbinella massiliensis TaxID=1329796 RepID=UPI00069B52EA|nr:M23 family metallopeptidase [Risungbinella massiliensis]
MEPVTTAAVAAAADVVANRKEYFGPKALISTLVVILVFLWLVFAPFSRVSVANGMSSTGDQCVPSGASTSTLETIEKSVESDSTLKGKASLIESTANANNIPPTLFAAILLVDSKEIAKKPKVDDEIKSRGTKFKGVQSPTEAAAKKDGDTAAKNQWESSLGSKYEGMGGTPIDCAGYYLQSGSGYFQFPLKKITVTSWFDWRDSPTGGQGREHHGGIDFDCGPLSNPDKVFAARKGTASVKVDPGGFGNYVVIDHGDGMQSYYGHLEKATISNGQVNQGQMIGYCGTTGRSTGTHLHFEVRKDGTAVNPKGYLPPIN